MTADEEGSRIFITATPNEGCTLESLTVTTTGGEAVELTGNSFLMPASAVTVTATYTAPETDAIEDIKADAATSVKKVLRKGRVVIIKNGKEYDTNGKPAQ